MCEWHAILQLHKTMKPVKAVFSVRLQNEPQLLDLCTKVTTFVEELHGIFLRTFFCCSLSLLVLTFFRK